MTYAITGANGFLGSALVAELLRGGKSVRALVRRPEAAAELNALAGETPAPPLREQVRTEATSDAPSSGRPPSEHGASLEIHRGDLTDARSLRGFVRDGDIVIHCAARVDMSGRWRDFERVNIGGTENVLAAALAVRPRRFVYISSGAVYGTIDPGGVCADRTPAEPLRYNLYGRSKLAGEQCVQAGCQRAGVPWTVLRLGFIYGAGNRALLQHVEPLLRKGKMILLGSGENRIATLEISDAAAAVLLAATRTTAAGRVYDVASDEAVTQRHFFEATADALGLPHPTRTIRPAAAWWIARVAELLARMVGRSAPLTRAMVDLMSADQLVDAGAIRSELGWSPRVDFDTGMRRMRAWCTGRRIIAGLNLETPPVENRCHSKPA